MRIENSTVAMASSRTYQAETQTVQTNIDRYHGANGVEQVRVTQTASRTKQLELSGEAASYSHTETTPIETGNSQQSGNPQAAAIPEQGGDDWLANLNESIENDPKIVMLRKLLDMLERFTGKKFNHDPLGLEKSQSSNGQFRFSASAASARYQQTALMFGAQELSPGGQGGQNGYWTRQTVQSAFAAGEEHTAFSSTGTVQTSDGRTLSFGISVEMSRSFEMGYEIAGEEAVFTDPLVINLDTDAASLSDVSFYFDLDCDGTKEEISSLGAGSGFLALDKNGDGEINDGSELFGARTGDGFGELAQYDQDGNGWIDENDEVFSKLSVWVKCGGGEAKLLSLKEANVGAIFLGSRGTQYSLDDSKGETQGAVRRSGIYLKETGQVGTVQHVDFKT